MKKMDSYKKNPLSSGDECILHVKNLPIELNNYDVLKQLFNSYGNVAHILNPKNVDWAYISYTSQRSAEQVIIDLNGKPPLNLEISFMKTKGNNKQGQDNCINSNDGSSDGGENFRNGIKGCKKGAFLRKPYAVDSTTKSTLNQIVTSSNTDDSAKMSLPFDIDNLQRDKNILWSIGNVFYNKNGKRIISLGHGQVYYQFPDEDPIDENIIDEILKVRNKKYHLNNEDSLTSQLGKCNYCRELTKSTCSKCYTFYCDRTCQISDWQRHKKECVPIPDLIINHQRSGTDSGSKSNFYCNPSNLIKTDEKPQEDIHNYSKKQLNQQDQHCDQEALKETSNSNYIKNKREETVFNSNKRKEVPVPNSFLKMKENVALPLIPSRTEASLILQQKEAYLSNKKFEKVEIINKENHDYWVIKIEDKHKLQSMMIKIQTQIEHAPKVTPTVGAIYAFQYAHLWHRVLLISISPLTIRCIDYGNMEIVELDDFREIEEFKDIPPFARKIRLSSHENKYEIGDEISVKMISIATEGTISVELENDGKINEENVQTSLTSDFKQRSSFFNSNKRDDFSQKNSSFNENKQDNSDQTSSNTCIEVKSKQNSSSKLHHEEKKNDTDEVPSILNKLSDDSTGVLQVWKVEKNICRVTFVPELFKKDYTKIICELPTECNSSKFDENYRPQIGTLVCGLGEDDEWQRGYVVQSSPSIKLASIDVAMEVPVKKVIPNLSNFSNILSFGAICELEGDDTIEPESAWKFNVIELTKTDSETIAKVILTGDSIIQATVRCWHPQIKKTEMNIPKLKSGSKICIVVLRHYHLLFVRCLDEQSIQNYKKLTCDTAKHALSASPVTEPVSLGQIILAKYTDGNYYRAVVYKAPENLSPNKVLVCFIDFGNLDVVPISNLKMLPDHLKKIPSCAIRVVLKDLPTDLPMNKEVCEYIMNFITEESPIICTFEGDPIKDGVYLTTEDGISINNTIKEMLSSQWKNINRSANNFTLDDLKVAPLGEVGENVQAIFLHKLDESKYVFGPKNPELVIRVVEELPKLLEAYATKAEYYVPGENELCVVLWQDGWYRGMCLNSNFKNNEALIFLVDYGNIEPIEYKNIRMMNKDFLKPDTLANICYIINFIPENQMNSKINEKLSELLTFATEVSIKIINGIEPGTYEVELPEIKNILISEKLLNLV